MAKQRKQTDPIEGVIEHLNFAKNGEPNGAVLDSGYFVHMKRRAAQVIGLRVGQKLQVQGKLKMSSSGGQKVIEADSVNGIDVTSTRAAKKAAPSKAASKPASTGNAAAKKAEGGRGAKKRRGSRVKSQ